MEDQLIVSLTSYGNRLAQLPMVLGTIFSQSVVPELVVLNLSIKERVPSNVLDYLAGHNVEVNRVHDTKVYKKLIPTLIKHPKACVISIDDDFLYPREMIEDFMQLHVKYPGFPISGNRVACFGMQCHCGCASLTKAAFFGDFLYRIDEEVMRNCPSDDILYTYFATKEGHPYIQTVHEYFYNMQSCSLEGDQGYSDTYVAADGLYKTYQYLSNRFGPVENVIGSYIHDENLSKVIENIQASKLLELEDRIRASKACRIRQLLKNPFSWLKRL